MSAIQNKKPRDFYFYCRTAAYLGEAKSVVKAKVTSDKWHLKSLIINNLGVTLSLEIFLKSWLTNVNGILLRISLLDKLSKIQSFFLHGFDDILLLLNINYLLYHFLSKPCRKILWILNNLPKRGNLRQKIENLGKFLTSCISWTFRRPIRPRRCYSRAWKLP